MIPACRLQSRARRPAGHGFESHWGCDNLQTKLLIVGDSVMGGFVQASGDGDAPSDAALEIVLCSSRKKAQVAREY
jgi:hypothetical protein